MRGQRDDGAPPVREHVETICLDWAAFDAAARAGSEVRENLEDERGDSLFVIRDGLDVNERTC
jgi:hypothetical protein